MPYPPVSMLVQPVHCHTKPIPSSISIIHLNPSTAASIYNKIFTTNSEFYPQDIHSILTNNLNLGTFIAIKDSTLQQWDPQSGTPPANYAITSVWNTKEVYRLQVKGVSRWKRAFCAGTRVVDTWMAPCFRVPSIPDVFRRFGVYVMYGIHMGGENGRELMRWVCDFVHNMGKEEDECGAVVGEVSVWDPAKEGVPHWRRFSWAQDVWCIKRLEEKEKEKEDWIAESGSSSSSSSLIFVDPRDF